VFRRCGRTVHGAGRQHDGSSPSVSKLSYGNCFGTAGIVVRLPFCARAVCLPALARLHLPGKGKGPGKVEMAAALISLLALAFPDRMVHVVADAAYHGPALRTLPDNVTWTCRIPRNAVLYDLAPPRTGRRGRPRTKGDRPGTAGQPATRDAHSHRCHCLPSLRRPDPRSDACGPSRNRDGPHAGRSRRRPSQAYQGWNLTEAGWYVGGTSTPEFGPGLGSITLNPHSPVALPATWFGEPSLSPSCTAGLLPEQTRLP